MTTQDDARRAAEEIVDLGNEGYGLKCEICGEDSDICPHSRSEIYAAIILKHLATPAAQPAPASREEMSPGVLNAYLRFHFSAWLIDVEKLEIWPRDANKLQLLERELAWRAYVAGVNRGRTDENFAAPSQGERAGLSASERLQIEEVRAHDVVIKNATDLSLAQLERRRLLAIIDRLAPTPPHSPDGERE